MKKRWLMIILALVLSVLLSGCTPEGREGSETSGSSVESSGTDQAGAGEPQKGGSLKYGMTQDLVSLDPHITTDAGTRSVVFNMFEGLVKPAWTGELIPAVAGDYSVSPDALSYRFTLREGVRFHDGRPVTVEDILYSIRRYAEAQGETSAFSLALREAKKLSETEVEIVLNEPDSEFISELALAIVPKDWDDPLNPVGTGPYRYVSYRAGEYLDLERFEEYWGEEGPYLDTVRFRFLPDMNTAMTALEAGSIDVLNYLTSAHVQTLEKAAPGRFQIVEGHMNLVHALFLNNAYEPLSDERVRQAVCYAMDREEISNLLFGGKSAILGSHMIPALTQWYEPACETVYSFDLDKARELMKESGYEDGFSLVITVPSSYSQHVQTAEILKEQLSKIGIRVEIRQVEWSSWLSDVYHGRDYEATVIGFDGKLNPGDWLAKYASDAPNNLPNYSDPEYDEILEKALLEVDAEKKAVYYKELQMNLARHAASAYIEDPADFVALSSGFAGYRFYPTAAYDVSCIYMVGDIS